MSPSMNDNSFFLREHLPQVRANDDFERSVLALTALNHLPDAVVPESFEETIFHQARQLKLVRTIFYSAVGTGIIATIAYFIYVQTQPVHIPANYELPTVPALLIQSKVTPPAVPTPIDPVIMSKVEARVKKTPKAKVLAPYGVTGY